MRQLILYMYVRLVLVTAMKHPVISLFMTEVLASRAQVTSDTAVP